jgi:hypothetical protein
VNARTFHSVFGFLGIVFAIGASVVFSLVLGCLFQRERATELVAEIRRAVKRG